MTIIPDLPDLLIEQVHVADEIILSLRTTSPTAACPCCGTFSKRVHSRYTRTLHDPPSSGRPLHLEVQVRRFVCSQPTCARRIFAEQVRALARPHAQRTKRLQAALCQLGLVVGGQAGARLGSDLGICGSRDTILRQVRRYDLPAPKETHVIGVDDWGATRSRMCSRKDSRKEALTWGSAP